MQEEQCMAVEIIDKIVMGKLVKFIGFKKLVPEAQAPYQKHITDAGYDLSAVSINETEDYIEYGTGIAVEMPTGMVGLVFPRSSVTTKDLRTVLE